MRVGARNAMEYVGARVLFVALAGVALSVPLSAQDPEPLKALLVDLPGWEGEQAKVVDAGAGGVKTVARDYARGESEVTAVVMIGDCAVLQEKMDELKSESVGREVGVSEDDGFEVGVSYDAKDRSGAIIVLLHQGEESGAMFTLTFDGLEKKEAMALARRFDWKTLKAAAAKRG